MHKAYSSKPVWLADHSSWLSQLPSQILLKGLVDKSASLVQAAKSLADSGDRAHTDKILLLLSQARILDDIIKNTQDGNSTIWNG